MSRLILIDALSQVFRVFYAIRMLNAADGRPVNAVFGMARLFMQLEESYPSDYGAIAFDKGKCLRRTQLLPEYKGQRPPMPDELRQQLPAIEEWAEAFGWNLVAKPGVEADDLICGMCGQRGDAEALILSSDKDLSQLLADPQVGMLVHDRVEKCWRIHYAAEVQAHFGVTPAQIRDYLALLGDSADNIDGIPGCGPKTAANLLAKFGDVEGICNHLEEVTPPRVRTAIAQNRPLLERNLSLVQLDQALPDDWQGLEGIRRREPHWEKLLELCRREQFKSLEAAIAKRMKAVAKATPAPASAPAPAVVAPPPSAEEKRSGVLYQPGLFD